MTEFLSKAKLAKEGKKTAFPADLRVKEMVRPTDNKAVYEFVGSDTFSSEWNERRRYEVDAGRDMEPILYTPFYSVINDATLPRNVDTYSQGPGGVVFNKVNEGGEVKFVGVESSEFTVQLNHYAAGLEYSKDLMVYNQLWNVPIVERQAGIAYNALLNHVHFSPILDATYGAGNQTAASSAGASVTENFLLTIEDAIQNSRADQTNPRRGPYVLLVPSGVELTVEKALTREVQQGLALQSTVINRIQSVITYDGWSGTRGKKTATYPGVDAAKGYLVNLAYVAEDFQSFMKQDLMQDGTQDDISRFLMQVVWDCYFGAYANPIAAVEEITWPA